jgi:hypothetical protein
LAGLFGVMAGDLKVLCIWRVCSYVEEGGVHELGKMERLCPKVSRHPICCLVL